ncbi:MAG: hypothetical protein ACREBQ_07255, partial [Nitrososphaerales archaeon]
MDGFVVGIFGTSPSSKAAFMNSIAKKSEAEGLTVYHKTEGGKRFSFLDDSTFPDRIQGYARIASLSDYAYYIFPAGSKLTPPDGELAVLVDSQSLEGSIITVDAPGFSPEIVQSSFRGLSLSKFPVEERNSQSSIMDLSKIKPSGASPKSGTLVYVDRAFNVKGVGLVVLGFILSGTVSIHDKLRPIPGAPGKFAEVKGIQISDEDHESAGRGVRVGLSLKGVELKDLAKTPWLDDGSFAITNKLSFEYRQSPYYKQSVIYRDLHLQC